MSSQTTGAAGYLWAVLELIKFRITAVVTLTTATGYLLAARRLEWDLWWPALGVFVLASGSAALNQWQEREIDTRMKRTRGRPIPSGRMDSSWALFLSVVLILLGLYCLTSIDVNPGVLLMLGGAAVVWYNGVYTYLKRVTAFAVVPGALIGAIPPCIGYVSAGGNLDDPRILLVAAFFFIWQIPHFWLLMLMVGSEYRDAGLPTVVGKFTQSQLVRITFMWMLATAVSGLAFPALGGLGVTLPWSLALVVASVWFMVKATKILRMSVEGDDRVPIRQAFWHVNAFALMVMVCLSLDALWD